MQNKEKKEYSSPSSELFLINNCDIICDSNGIETPPTDENDGSWEIGLGT